MVYWASLKNHLGSILSWNDICERIEKNKKAQNDSSFGIPSTLLGNSDLRASWAVVCTQYIFFYLIALLFVVIMESIGNIS